MPPPVLLTASVCIGRVGHIAGVINPPAANDAIVGLQPGAADSSLSADEWFQAATEVPGSWWPDWVQWLAGHSGERLSPTRR